MNLSQIQIVQRCKYNTVMLESGRESGDVADPVRAGGYLVVDAWGTIQ